jgi:hypothetical protein
MPSKVLGLKTPYEMIYGKNEFIVPPKVFGCTCFVRDHRPSVGKLDPHVVKCIFIGYPFGPKGYKCWSPSERRTFVSMDMTFRSLSPSMGRRQISAPYLTSTLLAQVMLVERGRVNH